MRVRLCIGAVLVVTGCGPGKTPYPAALLSERPEERVQAIKRAAELGDRDAIPALVDRLEDDDEAVRFYAILALERLTGTRMGYDYRSPDVKRWRSVERWRQYVRHRATTTQPVEATEGEEAGAAAKPSPLMRGCAPRPCSGQGEFTAGGRAPCEDEGNSGEWFSRLAGHKTELVALA